MKRIYGLVDQISRSCYVKGSISLIKANIYVTYATLIMLKRETTCWIVEFCTIEIEWLGQF